MEKEIQNINKNLKDIELDMINLLLIENKIQRKKLKKEKLTDKEKIYDSMVPASVIINDLLIRIERKEKNASK